MRRIHALAAAVIAAVPMVASAAMVRPDHVVVVVMENHDYSQIIGNNAAPYVNGLASTGLLYTDSHGVGHPSQPNYLELFSGSNQGVTGDAFTGDPANYPASPRPFTTPNLGAALISHGYSFAGYSEDQPSVGYTDANTQTTESATYHSAGMYVRKHNPWVDWQNDSTNVVTDATSNQLPSSVNQPLTNMPSDFSQLPTVSFVIPNQSNDMHDVVSYDGHYAQQPGVDAANLSPYVTGTDINGNPVNDQSTIARGDHWLSQTLNGYLQWAESHNSLLVVTWDENDFTSVNHIATLVNGDPALFQQGVNNDTVNHYSLLQRLYAWYGLGTAPADAAGVSPLAVTPTGQLAVPEPASLCLLALGALGLLRRRR